MDTYCGGLVSIFFIRENHQDLAIGNAHDIITPQRSEKVGVHRFRNDQNAIRRSDVIDELHLQKKKKISFEVEELQNEPDEQEC